ncbi:MAG: hypothetical protein GWP19_05890 [Planctomycetia bacterium]|nr:hypothetical protein [Planctomycetia bacterium]
MMLKNKAQLIVSSLTAIWLLIFLMASTSHMGIAHQLYFSDSNSNQINLSENNQNNNKDCPWTNATSMTSGDNPPIILTFSIDSDNQCYVVQNQYCLSTTFTISEPRAPPEILS